MDEFSRKLPFSLIAEQSLLGSILVDPEAITEISETIQPTDFYLSEHTQIYSAMCNLFIASKEIDIVTLIDTLVSLGVYSKSGGEDYIKSLYQAVPNALNIKDYAAIVKQKSTLRSLISICADISEKAYSEEGEATELVEYAEAQIFDIANNRSSQNFKKIQDVITNVYSELHTIADEGDGARGTKTGFSGIDNVLAGMGNSDLILVGARPGMGKTSFALNIAYNIAASTQNNPKLSVVFFSLEMSREQLARRIISSTVLIDSKKMLTGAVSDKEWEDIYKFCYLHQH